MSVACHPNDLSGNIASDEPHLHVSFVWILSCGHSSESKSYNIRVCSTGAASWSVRFEYDNEGNFCYYNRTDFGLVLKIASNRTESLMLCPIIILQVGFVTITKVIQCACMLKIF